MRPGLSSLLGWLAPGLSTAASALAWWRVALVGVAILAASNAISGLGAYNAGWRNAGNARAARDLAQARAHSEWLVKAAIATGALSANDTAVKLSNQQVMEGIEDAIAKNAEAVGKLGKPPVCVPASVLRRIADLR